MMNYRKHHKWFGIVLCLFLLMFAISGIVLNHRHMYGKVNVSRSFLPDSYHFRNWNNGLLRGTLRIGKDSVLIYGAGGAFLTDNEAKTFMDFNHGLPIAADSRALRNVVQTESGKMFAVGQFDSYMLRVGRWERLPIGTGTAKHNDIRFSDITTKGDSVIVVGRDMLYVGIPPYASFKPIELQTPTDYDAHVSLFRTVWLMHNGQLLGILGRVALDVIGVIFIFLCLSGIAIWLLPKAMKRNACRVIKPLFKQSFKWHERLGRKTFLILLFVTITGFALRPPLLIALAKIHTPRIPFTTLDTDNPWQDKLRALRWDNEKHDFLLSTSDGFYSMKSLSDTPHKESSAPPVSVMGINVFQKHSATGEWIVGSFSGIYSWDRNDNRTIDYITGEACKEQSAIPFGKTAVSSFTQDLGSDIVCTYDKGTELIDQPSWMEPLPMSLWQLALEIHTGRIYTVLGTGSLFYIFIVGIVTLWVLWSGWEIRKKKKKRKI